MNAEGVGRDPAGAAGRLYLQALGLTHSFPSPAGEQPVLREVSLSLARGEKVALLGRSGSGKSTLLNLLGGLDRPSGGQVLVEGVDLTALDERARTLFRRRHVGFIYQFFNLVPSLTARENVAFVLELNGVGAEESDARAQALLERVELGHKADSLPARLSGGEQQRVAIARALVHGPALVLADEPTGNLDARSGAHMLDLLRELLEASDSALLLVTHSLAAARMADRLLTLEDGVLREQGADLAW